MVVDVAFKLLIENVDAVTVDKSYKLLFVANVQPLTVNDYKTVALVAIKLYALMPYNPERFILEFIYYIY
jgi:hypothetical protein